MSWELRAAAERPNLLPGLGATFAVLVLLGVRGWWDITLHPLFQLLVKALDFSILGKHPLGFLSDWFDAADTHVRQWIGEGINSLGGVASQAWLWIAMQVVMVGVALAALGYELLAATHLIKRRTSPTFISQTVKPLTKPLEAGKAQSRVLWDSRVPALKRTIAAQEEQIKTLQKELAAVQSVALPAPRVIPRPEPVAKPKPVAAPIPQVIPKVTDLWDKVTGAYKSLGKLAKLGTVAGLIGLVAGSLARYGLGWLKCSKVTRTGKALCGLDENLLQSLLVDALAIFSTISIVEFAKELLAIEDEVVAGLRGFVREIR